MKKNTILESLTSRKFRFGGYATLLIVAALAVVIVVNVLVGQIPGKLDLTQNKIYSLSDETYKLLDGLKTDVTDHHRRQDGQRGPHGEGPSSPSTRRAAGTSSCRRSTRSMNPGLDASSTTPAARA